MPITSLLHSKEMSAIQILMSSATKQTDERVPENAWIHFDITHDKSVITATDWYVIMELRIDSGHENVTIADLISFEDFEWKQQEKWNVMIPPLYAQMIPTLWKITIHWEVTEWTFEPLDCELMFENYDDKIKIEKFQVNWSAPAMTKMSNQKPLFEDWNWWSQLQLSSHFDNFEKCLKKLNKAAFYSMTDKHTTATGTTENGYEFFLVVNTPIAQ